MKSLKDILSGTPEEYSDENLESSIVEAVDGTPPKVEKPAEADKVAAAMANLSDMVTMADEIYYTLSDLEEIEEELVGKIEVIFASLDELYKEVDETYDISVPEIGPTEVEEAEEMIGQSLDSILNETYEMAHPKTKGQVLTAMKRELRSMRVADLKASYQYIKAAHCNTKEGMDGMGTKKDTLEAMYKDLQAMKKRDLMASYEYIKSAHCGPQEGAHEDEMLNASSCTSEENEISEAIDFSKVPDDQLIAWIGRFRTVLTKAGLPLEVDRYVKGNPWSDFKKDFASAEKEAKKRGLKVESVDLEEMKTKDDDLAVMIYDYIGADTEGLPLKTLIHQAVGKYFGSQKDKKKVEGVTEAWAKIQKPFDANSELMRVVNSLDQIALNTLWDYKIIDKKRPVDVEGAIFPLYREATLKIFNVRGEDPFTDEQKKYLLDMYKKAQKGAGFGVGRKWHKMEFSKDGMEATAKIIVRSKEIFDKNQY